MTLYELGRSTATVSFAEVLDGAPVRAGGLGAHHPRRRGTWSPEAAGLSCWELSTPRAAGGRCAAMWARLPGPTSTEQSGGRQRDSALVPEAPLVLRPTRRVRGVAKHNQPADVNAPMARENRRPFQATSTRSRA